MSAVPQESESLVRCEVTGPVARITLNRPLQRNPLDWATIRCLGDLVREFEADPAIRFVVLRGAGGHFSAGGDLKGYVGLYADEAGFRRFLVDFHDLLERIENSHKIYLALIEGFCVAGGLEVLLACDIVLAAQSARIGDAHAGYGQMPGAGGSQRLPRAVGPMRARYLMLTGEVLSADEAERIGLVSRVVDDAALDTQTDALLRRLVDSSPLGLAGMKQLERIAATTDLQTGLKQELEFVWSYATTSSDATEGLIAFAEKRKPRFNGT